MDENIVSGPPVPTLLLADINIPLYQFILNHCRELESSVFMIDALTDEKILAHDVITESEILAAELQSLGCRPGLVIGILCENRIQYPIMVLAILRTGATVACFNPAYSLGELEHTMGVTQPYLMFVDQSSSKKLFQVNEQSRHLKYIISLENDVVPSMISYQSIFSRKVKPKFTTPNINDGHTAFILFSSGSTGLPKGVMLSSRSVIFLMTMLRLSQKMLMDYTPVILSVIPMFHGYGVLLLLRLIIAGGTIICLKKFNDKVFLATIEKYKVNNLALVPALMVFLAKHPCVNDYDLSSIRDITCGSAPLSIKIENEVLKKFQLNKVMKGYGMTETTILCTHVTSDSDDTPGTVGTLLPGFLAKIIDLETGEALGPNKEGEICLKGLLIMQGYYNNKKETESTIDKEGWLHTGDVGYYNDNEEFFIVDRIKDLIKYKGYQVAPVELESLLLKHDAVKDAAVIGVPDEIAGEVPRAFVVKLKDVTEHELKEYIAGQVAPHMKLRGGVKFIQEIPRSTNGKILRRELRNWPSAKL